MQNYYLISVSCAKSCDRPMSALCTYISALLLSSPPAQPEDTNLSRPNFASQLKPLSQLSGSGAWPRNLWVPSLMRSLSALLLYSSSVPQLPHGNHREACREPWRDPAAHRETPRLACNLLSASSLLSTRSRGTPRNPLPTPIASCLPQRHSSQHV